ncbi:hypothetical protein AURDEDRAFT_121022 [Auricularia subglabra TFB-10046 SS5]|nr:hypothetical protein AURDEDRAFT_121022 [Auricularia subglabra TFB-10046 SS5]
MARQFCARLAVLISRRSIAGPPRMWALDGIIPRAPWPAYAPIATAASSRARGLCLPVAGDIETAVRWSPGRFASKQRLRPKQRLNLPVGKYEFIAAKMAELLADQVVSSPEEIVYTFNQVKSHLQMLKKWFQTAYGKEASWDLTVRKTILCYPVEPLRPSPPLSTVLGSGTHSVTAGSSPLSEPPAGTFTSPTSAIGSSPTCASPEYAQQILPMGSQLVGEEPRAAEIATASQLAHQFDSLTLDQPPATYSAPSMPTPPLPAQWHQPPVLHRDSHGRPVAYYGLAAEHRAHPAFDHAQTMMQFSFAGPMASALSPAYCYSSGEPGAAPPHLVSGGDVHPWPDMGADFERWRRVGEAADFGVLCGIGVEYGLLGAYMY